MSNCSIHLPKVVGFLGLLICQIDMDFLVPPNLAFNVAMTRSTGNPRLYGAQDLGKLSVIPKSHHSMAHDVETRSCQPLLGIVYCCPIRRIQPLNALLCSCVIYPHVSHWREEAARCQHTWPWLFLSIVKSSTINSLRHR